MQVNHKPIALLHVGLAKCASTFLGDQAEAAARRGAISALVWRPFDLLINQAARELGLEVEAFPGAVAQSAQVAPDRPLFATNECLTGHFPQPLRLVSHPTYTGEKMRALQQRMAELLLTLKEQALQGFDTRILLVTRSSESWLRSLYRNLVIMGIAELPDEFFSHFGSVVAQWADVNYLLSLYHGLFGAENVFVMPIEMLRKDPLSFFEAVNQIAGATIITENDARNVGLSEGASERFRKLWQEVDQIAPPQPSWSNWTVRYKQETWEFLHHAILNDQAAVDRANAVWRDDAVRYRMPQTLIQEMQSRMTLLREIKVFSPYLDDYFTVAVP